jgi:3-aminobutyryl-CoA ammonia-lyase
MTEELSEFPQGFLRLRFGLLDTHYPGGLIPAAIILRCFADCSSEIGMRVDGVDGYLAAYESAEFLKPVHAGDYVEIRARVVSKGNRSRRVAIEAHRVIEEKESSGGLSRGVVHDPPELVARAVMVAVRPKEA